MRGVTVGRFDRCERELRDGKVAGWQGPSPSVRRLILGASTRERVLVKLPHADQVVIEPRKVYGYLLSRSHPVGRFKARVFGAVGFDASTADMFVKEVRRIAETGDVSSEEEFEYGRKYTVVGDLRGPAGALRVLTVWIREPGAAGVRLVTVRPIWP